MEDAEASRKSAEQKLEGYKAQVAPTRSKIEAFGQRYISLQESYQSLQHAFQQSERNCLNEQSLRKSLDPRLKAAEMRVVELEASSQSFIFPTHPHRPCPLPATQVLEHALLPISLSYGVADQIHAQEWRQRGRDLINKGSCRFSIESSE